MIRSKLIWKSANLSQPRALPLKRKKTATKMKRLTLRTSDSNSTLFSLLSMLILARRKTAPTRSRKSLLVSAHAKVNASAPRKEKRTAVAVVSRSCVTKRAARLFSKKKRSAMKNASSMHSKKLLLRPVSRVSKTRRMMKTKRIRRIKKKSLKTTKMRKRMRKMMTRVILMTLRTAMRMTTASLMTTTTTNTSMTLSITLKMKILGGLTSVVVGE